MRVRTKSWFRNVWIRYYDMSSTWKDAGVVVYTKDGEMWLDLEGTRAK